MIIINKIFNYRKTKTWDCRNNENIVEYLRPNGIKVGNNVIFRYPKHTAIGIGRPSLISIGDNLEIYDRFDILTHDFGVFVNIYHGFISSLGRVTVGDNIYFRRNVIVLKGVFNR